MTDTIKESYGVVYVQSSNPSKTLLDWISSQTEDGKIVYLQSGTPPPPPPPKIGRASCRERV